MTCSPVLRVIREVAEHADTIHVRVKRNAGWRNVAFHALTPAEQAEYLDLWIRASLNGWPGPYRLRTPHDSDTAQPRT